LAKQSVLKHPQLGLDNVETKSNTVSASSRKLVAFNTIATAIALLQPSEGLRPAPGSAVGRRAWQSLTSFGVRENR
jgi:hypothetical protein